MNKCFLCVLMPVIVSGLFGFFTGSLAENFGWSHEAAATAAGLVGFLAAQSFNYVCLLVTVRYRADLRRHARKTRMKGKANGTSV